MKLQEYKSIEDKEKIFGERYKYIFTVKDFDEWYSKEVKCYTLFRGLNNASYKNYTSVQRLFLTHDFQIDPWKIVEKEIEKLKHINNGFVEKYITSIYEKSTDFSYLSYLQHYRDGVTPLLDFTKDAKTALFFMCDGCDFPKCGDGEMNRLLHPISSFASIYMMSNNDYLSYDNFAKMLSDEFAKEMKQKLNVGLGEEYDDFKKILIEETTKERLETYLSMMYIKSILGRKNVVPFVLDDKDVYIKDIDFRFNIAISNPNLVAQNGCFLFHPDEYMPFENYVSCVDIHKSLIPYIKKHILGSDYTRSTMFPDMNQIISTVLLDSLADIYAE